MKTIDQKSHNETAVHRQNLSRHIGGIGTGKEEHGVCNVFRKPDPSYRNAIFNSLNVDRIKDRGHIGVDKSGANRVCSNITIAKFLGDRASKTDHPSFGRGIIRLSAVADKTADAGDINDAPPLALTHRFNKGARNQERSS